MTFAEAYDAYVEFLANYNITPLPETAFQGSTAAAITVLQHIVYVASKTCMAGETAVVTSPFSSAAH